MVYSSTVHDFAPGLMSALFYGVVSGSMSFMNKVILTSYKFNYPDVVMLAQIVTTSIILEIARKCGWCSIPKWTFDRGREFMIPSCCFALHTTMALYALEDLSIPIYNVLRRMLPLATLLMSYFVLHKVPSKGLAMSVGLIVAGSLFAGLSDIAVHLVGYINALSSVAAQATYLTYVERTGIEKSSSAIDIFHCEHLAWMRAELFSLSVRNYELCFNNKSCWCYQRRRNDNYRFLYVRWCCFNSTDSWRRHTK